MKSKDSRIAEIFEVKYYPSFFVFGPHAHSQIEINYVRTGRCSLHFDNEVVHFKKHDIMIIFPNAEHLFKTKDEKAQLVQLEFDLNILENTDTLTVKTQQPLLNQLKTYFSNCIKITYHPVLAELIQNCVYELNASLPLRNSMAKAYYQQIIIHLYRYLHSIILTPRPQSNIYIDQAFKLIHNHFYDQDIIKKITQNLSISDRYLRKLFKDQLGISPKNYISGVRLKKAKEYLTNEHLSLKEISSICGFSSPHHFIHFFKSHTNQTPGDYRKKNSDNHNY